MSTIAANDAKETLSELVSMSDTLGDAVIVNRGEPLAHLVPAQSQYDVDQALAAAARILETARRIGRNNITLNEIRFWTDHGRS